MSSSTTVDRSLVFISHASPQDNEFTKWLAAQLASAGYLVWSDVTKVIGGEQTWSEIDDAIRNHAVKLLFVLSHASNNKDGCLKELNLADTIGRTSQLSDFTIPLRIDDLPHKDMHVLIHGKHAIDFGKGWADGLFVLLEKLERDHVPRNPATSNPNTVREWWKRESSRMEVISQPESLMTNWLEIRALPSTVYLHRHSGPLAINSGPFPYHALTRDRAVFSFATRRELGLLNSTSTAVPIESLLSGSLEGFHPHLLESTLIVLLKQAWNNYAGSALLPSTSLSQREECFYFTEEVLRPRKLISFDFLDIGSGRKALFGKLRERTWHFGLSVNIQFYPLLSYVLYARVLIAEPDGRLMISRKAMNSARASLCKDWWNDDWRDRLLASLTCLQAGGLTESLSLPVSETESVNVAARPYLVECPVSYRDNEVIPLPVEPEREVLGAEGLTDV